VRLRVPRLDHPGALNGRAHDGVQHVDRGGARAGLVAPDDTTYEYLAGRPFAPAGAEWEAALSRWRGLPTDEGAAYDRSIVLDGAALEPMITFGTSPEWNSDHRAGARARSGGRPHRARIAPQGAGLHGHRAGKPLLGRSVDVVFIGSCTNGRLSDLRAAAGLLRGRKVNPKVRVLIVPGSKDVKRQAEAEGLAEVFRAAGAEWRRRVARCASP